jgi:hypothetical protein
VGEGSRRDAEEVLTLEVAAVTVVREAVALETLGMAVPVAATPVTTVTVRPAPVEATVPRRATSAVGVGADRAEERRGEGERDHRSEAPSIHREPPSTDRSESLSLLPR